MSGLQICIVRSMRRLWLFWPLTRIQGASLGKCVFKTTEPIKKSSRALGRKIDEIRGKTVFKF